MGNILRRWHNLQTTWGLLKISDPNTEILFFLDRLCGIIV